MKYKFKREPVSNAIIVSAVIDNRYKLKFLLDTGASHTTIDSTVLYLFGYDLSQNIGTVQIETANGVVETEVFEIQSLDVLGVAKKNYKIQVYDFLAHGILSDYNGLLGLDFFEGTTFCIDTLKDEIHLSI